MIKCRLLSGEESRRNKFVGILKKWIEPTCLLLIPTLQINYIFTQWMWKKYFFQKHMENKYFNPTCFFLVLCPFQICKNSCIENNLLYIPLTDPWISAHGIMNVYIFFQIADKLGFRSKPVLILALHAVRKLPSSVGQARLLLI